MPTETRGSCPHCSTQSGPVGDPCPACPGYHFIPAAYLQAAHALAEATGKPIEPLLGRALDRYVLAGQLGQGGMGAVFVALQKPLGREVALKIILGMDSTEAALARFEREARAISALDHPNIVKLYDYGVGTLDRPVPFMALEYVRHGKTLRRALGQIRKTQGGTVPGDMVLTVFRQILGALGAAHAHGFIHRDIKPDNVMVAPVHGNPLMVKVLDFGLAAALSDRSGFDGDVSRTGQLLGTPYYMAPEQAMTRKRAKVDERADLYAVAVMLFEVFTGVRPHEGDSALEILAHKVDPSYDPFKEAPAEVLTPALIAFLKRGMAINPEDRFPTAEGMTAALEEAMAGRAPAARGPGPQEPGAGQDQPPSLESGPWPLPRSGFAPASRPVSRAVPRPAAPGSGFSPLPESILVPSKELPGALSSSGVLPSPRETPAMGPGPGGGPGAGARTPAPSSAIPAAWVEDLPSKSSRAATPPPSSIPEVDYTPSPRKASGAHASQPALTPPRGIPEPAPVVRKEASTRSRPPATLGRRGWKTLITLAVLAFAAVPVSRFAMNQARIVQARDALASLRPLLVADGHFVGMSSSRITPGDHLDYFVRTQLGGPAQDVLRDPWGNPYRVRLVLERKGCLFYSAGPDGDPGECSGTGPGRDDVCTFIPL